MELFFFTFIFVFVLGLGTGRVLRLYKKYKRREILMKMMLKDHDIDLYEEENKNEKALE